MVMCILDVGTGRSSFVQGHSIFTQASAGTLHRIWHLTLGRPLRSTCGSEKLGIFILDLPLLAKLNIILKDRNTIPGQTSSFHPGSQHSNTIFDIKVISIMDIEINIDKILVDLDSDALLVPKVNGKKVLVLPWLGIFHNVFTKQQGHLRF